MPKIRIRTVVLFVLITAALASAAEPYKEVVSYEFGQDRKALTAIEEEIRKAGVDGYPAIEERLLATLQASGATFDGKQWCCRRLRQVGSEKSLPALKALLMDEKMSSFARLAMEGMKSDKVDPILIDVLGRAKGKIRIGLISSLGARRSGTSVAAITKCLGDSDTETAGAAIYALGRIGSDDAVKALMDAKVPSAVAVRRAQALIDCGYALVEADKKDMASKIATDLFTESNPQIVRIGAMGLLFRVEPEKATAEALKLLNAKGSRLAAAAGQLLARAKGQGVTKALADRLPKAEPASQAVLISTLTVRGDSIAAPAIVKTLESSTDKTVRTAAVKALGDIGTAAEVPVLAKLTVDAELARDAGDSLRRLSGKGVSEAIGKIAMDDADEKIRAIAVDIITSRGESSAMDSVLKATADKSSAVRRAAFKALGAIGKGDDLGKMVAMLVKSESSSEISELGRSIFIIAARIEGEGRTRDIIAGLKGAAPPAQAGLLGILGRLGGKKALDAVRNGAADSDATVSKAALKAMISWPDASPLEDLLKIAETGKDDLSKILALQGFINMVPMAGRSLDESAGLLEKALSLAARADEKKAALSVLSDFASDGALEIAKKHTGNPELKKDAELAIRNMEKAMKFPAAFASSNGSRAKYMVDGKDKSSWASGRQMNSGDWIAVEFRKGPKKIQGFTMTIDRARDDYPRSFDVFVYDGKEWSKQPVAQGKGKRGKDTRVTFKQPLDVKALKVVLTAGAGNNWSVYEIRFDAAP